MPAMTADVSRLSAPDAEVALRTFGRRFRTVFAPVAGDPDGLDGLAARLGPAGRSATDHLTDAVRSLAMLGQALHQILFAEAPVLHSGVVDAAARGWEPVPGERVEALLDELADEATAMADATAKVSGRDWSRTGTVAGHDGRTVSALDVLREAVRTCATDLDGATAALAAARAPG